MQYIVKMPGAIYMHMTILVKFIGIYMYHRFQVSVYRTIGPLV